MGLLFQIEGVKLLGERVWRAPLSPAEVRLLGLSALSTSDRTVLLLGGHPSYDARNNRIAFDPSAAKLLCAGTSSDAILVGCGEATQPSTPLAQQQNRLTPMPSGDAAFLSVLPTNLAGLGRALLEAVRSRYAGELRLHRKSGRYVDTPDNFWTIKPQPRDGSFRITVRGTPERFSGIGGLQIRADRASYSSFKIKELDQIPYFNRVMEQVRRR